MALSEHKEEEMYTKTIETARDMTWFRERLEHGDERMNNCDKRMDLTSEKLSCLDGEWKLLKGKLGLFVLILSGCFTAVLHGIGWVVAHFWK